MLLRSFVRSLVALFALGCAAPPATAAPAAVSAALDDAGVVDDDPYCGLLETICGPNCADLRTDPRHCGACGYACASDGACVSGRCFDNDHLPGSPRAAHPDPMLPTHALRCASNLAACGEQCVDLATDLANCGDCGVACSGRCVRGHCRRGGV